MEAKAKSGGPSAPKAASKAEKPEKKEAAAPSPRKPDPAPVDPPPPPAEVPEAEAPPLDGGADQEGAAEGEEGDEAAGSNTDTLESLKPFLIGGAIIAAGAILLGALLLARRN